MNTPTFMEPGAGVRYDMMDGTHVVRADPAATGGAYEVFEVEAPRAPMAPPHASPWTATMHVLAGTVRVLAAGEEHELGAGATFTAPGGLPFTFEVLSDSARFLAVTSGDLAGRFFTDFAATVPTDGPIEEALPHILAVTDRHGVRVEAPTSTA